MNKFDLETPSVVIDLDILEHNITNMSGFMKSHHVNLRPHIKTHKIPEIAALQIKAGATGITCAKISEAEVMLAVSNDVFIANMIVGQQKIERLLQLAKKIHISVGVDCFENAEAISIAAAKHGLQIPVVVKIDSGLKRTGVESPEKALALCQKLDKLSGIKLHGIYTHEGHAYGETDPIKLKELGLSIGQMMVDAAGLLQRAGFDIKTVSVGTTPLAKVTPTVSGITEARPGTYVFNDIMGINAGVATAHDCALTVLATVISTPTPDRAVIDAGTKILSSDKAPAYGSFGIIKNRPDLKLARAYEEHGVITFDPQKETLKINDRVEIIPNHVCPVVNLVDDVFGIRGEKIETHWKVAARGAVH